MSELTAAEKEMMKVWDRETGADTVIGDLKAAYAAASTRSVESFRNLVTTFEDPNKGFKKSADTIKKGLGKDDQGRENRLIFKNGRWLIAIGGDGDARIPEFQ